MQQKEDSSNLLLTMPEDVKKRLQEEAAKQNRTLNSYIVWLLANRPKEEKPE